MAKHTSAMCALEHYNWPSDLTKHKRQVHTKVKYDCDQCNESFDHLSKLSRHKQKVHQGIRFECRDCGKEYARETSLTRHRKQHHKGSDPDPFQNDLEQVWFSTTVTWHYRTKLT